MLARILGLLFPAREDEAVLAELSDDTFFAQMAPEVVPGTSPPAVALFPFADARVRAAIHEAKYHGAERAFRLLAEALADYLRDYGNEMRLGSYALVPVPLGDARRRERGFNQAEEVAKRAGHLLGVGVESGLICRVRETASQVTLPRWKRRSNMRGAFGAAHPADPSVTYILIDDVTTTGATLSAALEALRAAGATRIVPVALAH